MDEQHFSEPVIVFRSDVEHPTIPRFGTIIISTGGRALEVTPAASFIGFLAVLEDENGNKSGLFRCIEMPKLKHRIK